MGRTRKRTNYLYATIRRRILIFLLLLIIVVPATLLLTSKTLDQRPVEKTNIALPPDLTGLSSVPIQAIPMPGYLQTVADPTFGDLVTRISDQTAFGTSNLYLTHEYSTVQTWNADGSLLLLNNGWNWDTAYLLDGNTGAYLRTVHAGALAGHTPRWSNVNPNNIYGIPSTDRNGGACNNTNRLVVWHPKTDTSSYPVLTVLHTFTQFDSYADPNLCANMTFGLDKGNFSNDDSLGVVIGWSTIHNSWGITTFHMTNVNTDTPTITEIATRWLGTAGGTSNNPDSANWNNLSATPKGDGVLVQWKSIGSGINQGIEWLSSDLTMTKHVTNAVSHYDEGLDASGNEMVVTNCGQSGSASTNTCTEVSQNPSTPFIAGYYLNGSGPTGASLNLYPSSYPHLTYTVHISCRNQYQRPGWCYISDFQNNPSFPVGYEQIYALKLDGSKTVEVFGVDHGSYDSCFTCNEYTARAVPSRDGSKVIFTSDWGAGTSAPSYDYIVQWP